MVADSWGIFSFGIIVGSIILVVVAIEAWEKRDDPSPVLIAHSLFATLALAAIVCSLYVALRVDHSERAGTKWQRDCQASHGTVQTIGDKDYCLSSHQRQILKRLENQ